MKIRKYGLEFDIADVPWPKGNEFKPTVASTEDGGEMADIPLPGGKYFTSASYEPITGIDFGVVPKKVRQLDDCPKCGKRMNFTNLALVCAEHGVPE